MRVATWRNQKNRCAEFKLICFSVWLLAQSVQASGQGAEVLILPRFVAEVVSSHPSVAAKRAGLSEAKAGIDSAKSEYLPTPSVQTNRISGGGHSSSFILSQPVWAAGRIDAGLEMAEAKGRSAGESLLETQFGLAIRVADLYQSYRASRARLSAIKSGIERLTQLDEMMRRREESGVSAVVDRELGSSRLAQARSDFAFEESNGRALLTQLSQLAGREIGQNVILNEVGLTDVVPDEAVLIDLAVANHPALRRASADVESALADADRQRAQLWPTVSLQGERRIDSRSGFDDVNQISIVLQYQPGAGFSGAARVRGAESRVLGMRDTQEGVRREVIDGLRIDYERYRAALTRIGDVKENVKSSREVLASYRRLFIAGKRSWLDVVNAARELTQAEQSLADLNAVLAVAPFRMRVRSGDVAWSAE